MPLNELVYRNAIAHCQRSDLIGDLPDLLLDLWCEDYSKTFPQAQLILVTLDAEGSSFTYLFDTAGERNIVAFGVPSFVKHKRDAARMAGHPLSQGKLYHRGHLMAHSIGGGADINLVPQLGKLNIGEFRRIERLVRKLAEDHVRCFYFVRTIYPDSTSQLPQSIEQGAVQSNGRFAYALHGNV